MTNCGVVIDGHTGRSSRAMAAIPWRPGYYREAFDALAVEAGAYCLDAVEPAAGGHRAGSVPVIVWAVVVQR